MLPIMQIGWVAALQVGGASFLIDPVVSGLFYIYPCGIIVLEVFCRVIAVIFIW